LAGTAKLLLLVLSAIILIAGVSGYFVLIRPYVKQASAIISESKDTESVLARERGHRLRMMSDLSHQLRTPLSAILGNAELMQRWDLDGKQRESVRALIGSASNMMHVLDEVMDETAIQKGELEVNRHKFNLHECVEQASEMLRPLTVSHHVTLTTFVSSDVPVWVVQDEKRFRQVLLNVAGDVIRHSEGKKIDLNVEFLNKAEGMVQLKITLIGVDPSLADIYSKLRDEHNSGALSRDLSLRLVHELGGRIWTEDGPHGRLLCITMIAEETKAAASENVRDLAGLKALIIEQDKNILKVLIRQLGTWGIQSTPFNSLELVEEVLGNLQKFDICIIDVDPPGGESLILAEKLARQTEGRLPIIALTSTADSVVESKSPLLNAYLTKPVKQIRLFETITGLLRIDDSLVLSQPSTGRSNAQIDQYALNVIIANDNELHRAVAARTLNLLGHRFENAFSLEELREKMSEKHYDLVLVGHDERHWKGFRLGQNQKDKNNKDSTVVIGVTNEFNAELPSGYDDLVKGGFTGEKLEEKIRNWFEFE
jgi:DNA-binding response OmpR family regulator